MRIILLYEALEKKSSGAGILGRQLLRSGTSVGAHYREAFRARSPAKFVSKVQGGIQELEETMYWLELVCESRFLPVSRLGDLCEEAEELMAILVASVKTAERNMAKKDEP